MAMDKRNDVLADDAQNKEKQHIVDFDEALSRLGFGRFNYILILLSGVIITTTTYETLGISFVFPVAECDLSLTTQNKGVLSGISSIGIIVSSHFWGFLADNKGRKSVIVPTLILSFLASFLSSLSTSFAMLVICRFLSGFFISGASATIFAYLGEFHSSQNRSKVLMAASFIYGLACNYLPALGFLILNRTFHFHIPLFDIEFKPWRFYLLLCGLPSLLSAIVLLIFIPESPKFTFSKGNEEETLNILREIHKINNPKDVAGYGVTKVVEDLEFIDNDSRELLNVSENPFVMLWRQTCLLFSEKNARKMILVSILQCGLFGSCHGLYMFFPEIVDKMGTFQNRFPDQRATVCEMVQSVDELTVNVTKYAFAIKHSATTCSEQFEISTFVHSFILEMLYMMGFLVITLIINRTSKLNILLVILFSCSVSGFATNFVDIPLLSVYIYVIFMCTLLAVNVVNAATVDLFPTNLRGMAINISMMFGRVGSVLGTNIVGFTLDNYCSETFTISSIILASMAVISVFIPKIRRIDGRKEK